MLRHYNIKLDYFRFSAICGGGGTFPRKLFLQNISRLHLSFHDNSIFDCEVSALTDKDYIVSQQILFTTFFHTSGGGRGGGEGDKTQIRQKYCRIIVY